MKEDQLKSINADMLEALELWVKFWEKMPKGQLGRIVCDIGILNDAFIKTDRAIARAKAKSH